MIKFNITKTKKIKTKINFHLLMAVFVIIVFSFLFSSKTQAKNFSLSITPPLLEVMIQPGKAITNAYQLTNGGDDLVITPKIAAFAPSDEKGGLTLLANTPLLEKKSWFVLDNADRALEKPLLLKSGASQQIVLRVKIPQEAREDDYYFTILFSSEPQGEIGSSGTRQAGTIGANILLTVSQDGQPVKKGEIVEFSPVNSQFSIFGLHLIDSFTSPTFLLRVKNTGRTFWKPFGKISLKGILNQKREEEILPENILSNSIRQIQTETSPDSPSFFFGPFRAEAELTMNENGPILQSQTSFLALPFKALFGVIFFLFVISIIKITHHKWKRRVK